MTPPPIRGVLFDATGTLIEVAEPVGETYHRIARSHGVDLPAWRLEDAFRRVLRHAPERGIEGPDELARRESERSWWFERLRQTFQAADSTARFPDFEAFARDAFDAYRVPSAWHVREGLETLLEQLGDAGLGMAVVSNFDHRLPEILEGLGLGDAFVTIEIPSRLGKTKPHPVIFGAAADRLGLAFESLAYVGDDPPERIAAIARLGLRVVDVNQIPAPADWATRLGLPAGATLFPSECSERPLQRR